MQKVHSFWFSIFQIRQYYMFGKCFWMILKKMVQISDHLTKEIIRDTTLENLLKRGMKEVFRYCVSFMSGAFGCYLIHYGVTGLAKSEDNHHESQSNNIRLANYKIIQWLLILYSKNMKILSKLLYGGVVGIGIWIMCQPLIFELRNLNQNIIYYVKN